MINGRFTTISGHFFWQLYDYISQNWGSDNPFEVLNRSKPWLMQKLLLKMQRFQFQFFCDSVEKNAFVFFEFWYFFCILCHNCCTNHDSNLFSTSKWLSESHIVGTKMARYGCKMAINQMQMLMINLWFSQDLDWPQVTFCVITFEPIKILTH
jgi:hypothetical protein